MHFTCTNLLLSAVYTVPNTHMPPITCAEDLKQGSAIVRHAIRHGIVPDFKQGVPLREQTPRTQWALHVLAVFCKDGKVNMREVKHVIKRTEDLIDQV